MNNIPNNLAFELSANIWATQLSPDCKLLAVEERDDQKHEVRFHIIDIDEMEWYLVDFQHEEKWWCGLSGISGNVLLIHTYENSDNPDQKHLYGIDVNTQEYLWKLNDWILSDHNSYSMKGRSLVSNLEESRVLYTAELSNETIIQEERKGMKIPIFHGEDSEYFNEFKSFIEQELNVHPHFGCDYIESNGFIIFSYYVRSTNGYDCNLAILDEDGNFVMNDTLESELKGMLGNSFFIVRNNLFFIRNKREICVYDLA